MTKILDGYAQPDVEATKGNETILTFVETPHSLVLNKNALKKSLHWLKQHRYDVRVDLVVTKPRST